MQNQRRTRRSFRVFFVLLAIAVAVVILYLLSGLFFKITAVEVEGNTVYTAEEIAEATGIHLGDNLISINKTAAVREVLAKYPYIERLRIRRVYPSVVSVTVTETVPVAYFGATGAFWVINATGVLLESRDAKPALPEILGATLITPVVGNEIYFGETEKAKKEPLLDLIQTAVTRDLWKDISEVDLTKSSDFAFRYQKRFTVLLGLPSQIGYKLEYMEEAVKRLEKNAKGTLDLSAALSEDHQVRFRPE